MSAIDTGRLLDLYIGIHERHAEPSRSRRPIDDLPAPIMPTSTIERAASAATMAATGGAVR